MKKLIEYWILEMQIGMRKGVKRASDRRKRSF